MTARHRDHARTFSNALRRSAGVDISIIATMRERWQSSGFTEDQEFRSIEQEMKRPGVVPRSSGLEPLVRTSILLVFCKSRDGRDAYGVGGPQDRVTRSGWAGAVALLSTSSAGHTTDARQASFTRDGERCGNVAADLVAGARSSSAIRRRTRATMSSRLSVVRAAAGAADRLSVEGDLAAGTLRAGACGGSCA